MRNTSLKVASSKGVKYEEACFDNQYVFIPFVFDTFDFLALMIINLLRRIQKVMHNNVVSPIKMNVVFKKIKFNIQNEVAEQLVVCLKVKG